MGIITHGSLANLVLSPALRDRIISAQEHDVGMEKIRQRLVENDPRTKCFSLDEAGVLWFKNRLVVPKDLELRKQILMKPISLDILSTQAAIKCIKI